MAPRSIGLQPVCGWRTPKTTVDFTPSFELGATKNTMAPAPTTAAAGEQRDGPGRGQVVSGLHL
ncbi:MAG: hypothetical protein M3O46_04875 [Myxococcota bacterium]|nr:hypothetical protein [Myxococcota bacterium]